MLLKGSNSISAILLHGAIFIICILIQKKLFGKFIYPDLKKIDSIIMNKIKMFPHPKKNNKIYSIAGLFALPIINGIISGIPKGIVILISALLSSINIKILFIINNFMVYFIFIILPIVISLITSITVNNKCIDSGQIKTRREQIRYMLLSFIYSLIVTSLSMLPLYLYYKLLN